MVPRENEIRRERERRRSQMRDDDREKEKEDEMERVEEGAGPCTAVRVCTPAVEARTEPMCHGGARYGVGLV